MGSLGAACEAGAAQQADRCACECACGKKSQEPPALFVDEEFPARWHVLCARPAAAAWLRPHELCAEPRLFKEGSRFNVLQGDAGDCWFMAACAAVAEREDILKQVIPEGQVLFGPGYDGSVRFRLWHLGEWVEVRVDDRLPVNEEGMPVYARCQRRDEFWMPLLEKAFAKFHKHFGMLDQGGWISEGLINLTGYSMKLLSFEHWNVWNTDEYFLTLKNAFDNGGLIVCCTITSAPGIPGGHAYTVTKVYQRDPSKDEEKLQLVRVRNPWGYSTKWNGGAWKDGDERWAKLTKEEKEVIEYDPQENGEFWMDMEDFKKNFVDVVIGTEKPTGADEMKVVGQITGSWSKDEEVGGNHTELEKFAKNPQFSLVPIGSDVAGLDDHENSMEGMEVIVELVRCHRRLNSSEGPNIAFYVFEWSGEQRLSAEQLRALERVEGSTRLMREVAVSACLRLRPGRRYVVIPATERAGQEGHFLLRVFSRHARVRLAQLPPAPTPTPPPQPAAAT